MSGAGQEAETAMRQGRFLAAHDLAEKALASSPENFRLRHFSVLALARSGNFRLAADLFDRYFADAVTANFPATEIISLKARIEKDRAIASASDSARPRFLSAAGLYETAFNESNDPYPGINAASLYLWGGDRKKSIALARACLQSVFVDDYYGHVSQVEAHLLLGQMDKMKRALERACSFSPTLDQMATSWRQMSRSCQSLNVDEAVLQPIIPGRILRYAGSLPWPKLDGLAEDVLKATIRQEIGLKRTSMAFGALAAGADILFAEVLNELQIPVQLVFPFALDRFVEVSVRPFGNQWEKRFSQCLEQAAEVNFAANSKQPADGASFRNCSSVTMGLAINTARQLDTFAEQISVWNGRKDLRPGGTGEDLVTWAGLDLQQSIIRQDGTISHESLSGVVPAEPQERQICAILFADFTGFGSFNEEQTVEFYQTVLPLIAQEIDATSADVLASNTWGDGLFVIFSNVTSAARTSLNISRIDWESIAGVPMSFHDLKLRIGLHCGPASPVLDPVTKRPNYAGIEVSFAARLEPVSTPGEVFVTQAFASHAAAEKDFPFQCEYMGQVKLAKSAGLSAIYRLVGLNNQKY